VVRGAQRHTVDAIRAEGSRAAVPLTVERYRIVLAGSGTPGYTFAPSPFGLFVVHKVEDLYAEFLRPFYAQ
jgi:hypothetical protein